MPVIRARKRVGFAASLRVVITLLALVSMVAACGDNASDAADTPEDEGTSSTGADSGSDKEWDEIVEAAEQEGQVVLYMSPPGFEEVIQTEWAKAYPDIELELVREASGELITRMDQEKAAGSAGADVAFHATLEWFTDNEADLAPVTGPAVESWEGTDYDISDNKIFFPMLNPYVIGVNTDVIAEVGADPIVNWEDALQPELKGLVATSDIAISQGVTQFYYLIEQEIPDYWDRFGALEPQLYESVNPAAQALAAGEFAISHHQSVSTLQPLKEQGAPIDWVIPADKPAMGTSYNLAALGWAEHPNAAQVLSNWLLSLEGQTLLHNTGTTASPVFDIEGQSPLPDGMVTVDGLLTEEQKAFIPTWNQKMGR